MKCFRPRRKGQMRRKSVRGCIVSGALSVLNLTVYKPGERPIPGLTDGTKPNRMGPKRAGRIRKKFGLRKENDLRPFVARRTIEKDGKTKTKAPKIQRLVTSVRIMRKRHLKNVKKTRQAASAEARQNYEKLINQWTKDQKEKRMTEAGKKKKVAAK
eukprot:GHVN01063507.1.p1 GENE.GHVN01063507.1~~GHVN01063507.1.p1  ORF type:complete len:157 (-),score=17.44 GHVN01063507.1:108-578(-)